MNDRKKKFPRVVMRRLMREQTIHAISGAAQVRREGEAAGTGQTSSPEQDAENRLQNNVIRPLAAASEVGTYTTFDTVKATVRKRVIGKRTAKKQQSRFSDEVLPNLQPESENRQQDDVAQPLLSMTDTGTVEASETAKRTMRKQTVRKKESSRRKKSYSDKPFPVSSDELQPFQQMNFYPLNNPESGRPPIIEAPPAMRREVVRRQSFAKEAIRKKEKGKSVRQFGAGQRSDSLDTCPIPIEPQTEKKNFLVSKDTVRAVPYAAQPAKSVTESSRKNKRQHFVKHIAIHRYLATEVKQMGKITHEPRLTTPRISKQGTVRTGIRNVFRFIVEKLRVSLGKMLRKTAASMIAVLGAGAVVLLLVVTIGAAAAMIGSPMGILFAEETADPNAIPIADIVQETNIAFGRTINEIAALHPECDEVDIQYYYEAGHTWASYWPEVLALFAVQTNLSENSNVIVIDAANAQKIQAMFWNMHRITTDVEAVEVEPAESEEETNRNPAPQYQYILHISVKGRTVDEVADAHHFSADQRGILNQLLSAEMRPVLLALCSGSTLSGGAGTLHWPLPGINNITCRFGEPDAIRGQPHRGVDIAAPEGTPILAAHDGTVLISGWNDSYGNQVLLDNGAGLSTRYAHMTASAVTAGEIVTAGQVIGYVGSTGDSTGNHLHFEVWVNGQRKDAMDFFQK